MSMGEEVVSTFLRSKLSSILEEAEADSRSSSETIRRYRSIESFINMVCDGNSRSSSSSPIDQLYELIDALLDCRVLAHQQHKAAASKKGFFHFITVDPLTNMLFKRNMRNRLAKIEKKIKPTPQTPAGQSSPRAGLAGYPIADPSHVIGLESQVERIKALLVANKNSAATTIGIVGRYGCGKTALAEEVFGHPEINDEFSPKIWVCLSNINLLDKYGRVDPRQRVVISILKALDTKYEALDRDDQYISVVGHINECIQRESMGKRYLIVLDDVWWQENEWFANGWWYGPRPHPSFYCDEFFYSFPGGSGGAIMVTSRQESVIRTMVGNDDEHVIRVEPRLSDEMCWQIFSHVVQHKWKIKPHDHPKLIQMKDDIIRKCDGLPLAANTLANIIPELLKS